MAEHDNAEPPSSDYLENRTFDELAIDESATLVRQLTERDIQLFAAMSGDINPAHLDEEFAREEIFHEIVAHGMWAGSLFPWQSSTRRTPCPCWPRSGPPMPG
ncbi:MaoC dehydratase-like protein [Halospina denitrificans]|uniref:MaoC dehydratase-like protein n=1 Tax=Halospina denitrificans TaxID=332522 RepID=A0A4R7JU04_9GAMM|nr:MaoC dehydratase-like protein [Halospina denitrificans]